MPQNYFRYLDAVLAVRCYCSKVPFPRASDLDASATSLNDYVMVDGKVDWDLPDSDAADAPSRHIVLNTKFMHLKATLRLPDNSFPLSMIRVVYLSLGRLTAVFAGDVCFNYPLQHTAE